ncbi:hypothetical protein P167DRAFT_522197 [Morchella conica CCBAS932]|uniref:PDZ GRASP-type domain-containing protein n=1 Tax=Morchella conica CCBAS932 TaxID=1392247 RepID=A0A3N4KRV8_9PEZI|nr:hypothetical protein P167DRAFT_522197 [Morchella conica CCBAS932]
MSWLKKFLPIVEDRPRGPGNGFGFQVLRNISPQLEVEPWFDFVCGINGRQIEDGNHILFTQEIRNCAGRDVTLIVWSAKGQRLRDIMIALPPDATGLGLTLQWCPLTVTEDVWHILDVAPNSPADHAGLLPYGDYIIGTPEGIVRGESGLGELVEDHIDRPLRLYVYNHEYDITRELTITPRRNWGGEGALGCVLGFGALHRLPAPLTEPPQAPGETLFDYTAPDQSGLNQFPPTEPAFIIPAASQYSAPSQSPFQALSPSPHYTNLQQLSSPPPPAKGTSRHKYRHGHPMNSSAMDAYMKEEEQKSLEHDFPSRTGSPAVAGGGSLPPPPRSSLPPPPRRTQTPLVNTYSPVPNLGQAYTGGGGDDID